MNKEIKLIPNLTKRQMSSFYSKINKTDTCWIWTANKLKGYGKISLNSIAYNAHRVSLFLYSGENIQTPVLHNCHNPSCVNPKHLRYGTNKENSQDAIKAKRTKNFTRKHCKSGHLLEGENLRIVFPNSRRCRTCDRINFKKYRKKVRQKEKYERDKRKKTA